LPCCSSSGTSTARTAGSRSRGSPSDTTRSASDAEVVSILPEPPVCTIEWQDRYDLPYPLSDDPDAGVGDAYDQPVLFGPLGKLSEFFG
jgi:peroxiredoxin